MIKVQHQMSPKSSELLQFSDQYFFIFFAWTLTDAITNITWYNAVVGWS